MILQIRRPLTSLCNQNLHLHLQRPFSISESLLLFSTSKPKEPPSGVSTSDYVTGRLDLSPETALKVSSYRSRLRDPEKADSVIDLLKDVGFMRFYLELTLQRAPRLLFCSVDNIRPKIKTFQDAGLCPSDIVKIISANPLVLTMNVDNRLFPSIEALKNIMGSFDDVSKVLRRCGWFLRSDPEKTLLPNVEMVKSCGVPSRQITRYLLAFPRMFLVNPEKLKGFVNQVDEMRVQRGTPVFLPAIQAVDVARELGAQARKKKIKEVSSILLETGEADAAFLVSRPQLLMLSAERRLKPRLRVLKILESKNLLKKKPSLSTVCEISEKVFSNKYVFPYLDVVGDAYGAVGVSFVIEKLGKLRYRLSLKLWYRFAWTPEGTTAAVIRSSGSHGVHGYVVEDAVAILDH
ncbi:hypothetical protein CRG98_005762 [Punica granatum]|uniref:Uncharacterized protein n=1 Tax=Punica granatum TaxID=22663 RepID=A0A2I0KZM1_PUNGR|nr:hypothetical protein CRG98_005762 [Punica granatum]